MVKRITAHVRGFEGREMRGNIRERISVDSPTGKMEVGRFEVEWMEGGRIVVKDGERLSFYNWSASFMKKLVKFLENSQKPRSGKRFEVYFNVHVRKLAEKEEFFDIVGNFVEGMHLTFSSGRKIEVKKETPHWKDLRVSFPPSKAEEILVETPSRFRVLEDLRLEFLEAIDHTNFHLRHPFPVVSLYGM